MIQAARRDASLSRSPGRAARHHVVVNDRAGCNQHDLLSNNAMPLQDHRVAAAKVDPVLRCRRNGCRERWPAWQS